MPARRNRPDKHGKTPATRSPTNQAPRLVRTALIDKFCAWERANPCECHYVGWPDMDEARQLAKRGLLDESPFATGCFWTTPAFREAFLFGGISQSSSATARRSRVRHGVGHDTTGSNLTHDAPAPGEVGSKP